jgi:hypothetical protein
MKCHRTPVIDLILLVWLFGCSAEQEPDQAQSIFDEHTKKGHLSLIIVGNYFHNSYILELTRITQSLSPQARQIILCTEKYKNALTPFLATNGVKNVEYVTVDESSFILTQWARDVAVAGKKGDQSTIVVSPNKHADSKPAAEAIGDVLESILPDRRIQIAPFVFEAGNLAFVESDGQRVLIVGRKMLFDNEVYQTRPWAAGYDSRSLLKAATNTFGVDTVLVVGRSRDRPRTRMYFEYHIDMGMVLLKGNRAVVSQLVYGEEDEAALARAIVNRHPVVTPFLTDEWERSTLLGVLSKRLLTVALEYEDYASVLDSLGVEVHRSSVSWQQILGSMSWTNVLQTGDRILMPLYPDSLHGVTRSTREVGGQIAISLDVSRIKEERFDPEGANGDNYSLYRRLGYDVVTVPEYLHYMMGGIHCFVNILE